MRAIRHVILLLIDGAIIVRVPLLVYCVPASWFVSKLLLNMFPDLIIHI